MISSQRKNDLIPGTGDFVDTFLYVDAIVLFQQILGVEIRLDDHQIIVAAQKVVHIVLIEQHDPVHMWSIQEILSYILHVIVRDLLVPV